MRRKNIIEFRDAGGSWLGTVRNWIQCNCINGERVNWGSNDELKLNRIWSPKVLEEIALRVAHTQYEECESKKPNRYTELELVDFCLYYAKNKGDKNFEECLSDWKKEHETVEH